MAATGEVQVAELRLFNSAGAQRFVILAASSIGVREVTVIVDGHWITIPVGEVRWVRSEALTYRVADTADILAWQPPAA